MEHQVELQPKAVFDCFEQLTHIPRPSKREEKIIAFLKAFGEGLGLETNVDETGNVIIKKPATPGYESRKTVILQSHMDMVCEPSDGSFDFDNCPIETQIDGEWLTAKGTTLGADDGIGVAMEMALLQANDIEHGPIECVFTRDEETGLTGAMGMKPGFMSGTMLINLDSEDEGQIFVSCAGGVRTTATYHLSPIPASGGLHFFQASIKGLTGGHSGDDINKKRANSNKILIRLLATLQEKTNLFLVDIQSGGLHNAIPREGCVTFAAPAADKELVRIEFNVLTAAVEEEFSATEPNIEMSLESVEAQPNVFGQAEVKQMILSLRALHNGVFAMSQDLDWLVETSSNLASIHLQGSDVVVTTSQRSSVPSALMEVAAVVRSAFELGGADTITNEGYPGWKMNPNSELLRISAQSYKRLFGKDAKILAIHAGLECGLFSEKYPGIDMVSFGPTLRGVHSPDERLLIPTVQKVWDHLLDILKQIPQK